MWEDEADGGSKAHSTQKRKMVFTTLFVPGTGASLCHTLHALNSPLGGPHVTDEETEAQGE